MDGCGCGRELWGRRLLGFIVHDGFISGTIKAALVGDLHSRQTCTHLRFARPNEPSCCGQPEINQLSRLRRHFRRMRNNKSTIRAARTVNNNTIINASTLSTSSEKCSIAMQGYSVGTYSTTSSDSGPSSDKGNPF